MFKPLARIAKSTVAACGLAACLALSGVTPALACTGIYVGKGASADGTTIIARTNDHQSNWANRVAIQERVEGVPGRTMPLSGDGSVTVELPETTYRYTYTPWMSNTRSQNGLQNDACAVTNEYGVAMTMAVTSFSNQAALDADPLVSTGITEATASELVICQSASAREAVGVLLGYIDAYGSSEVNIALIADQDEAWYVEMYTGHQYAAVLLPDDAVAVFGNEFTMRGLSEYAECIVSSELETLAVEQGFAVYGESGELDLWKTYSGPDIVTNYSHMRTWIGHQVFAPSEFGADYAKDDFYPLCFAPDQPVSVLDVMDLTRNRYEGTEFDPDVTGRVDMRVIGTDTAMSMHVIQVYDNLPADMACITWECPSSSVYGVYVPVSNAALSVSGYYGADQPENTGKLFETDKYAWYAIKELNTLALIDWAAYGQPVQDYWAQAEDMMVGVAAYTLEQAATARAEGAADADAYLTDVFTGMQDEAFGDSQVLVDLVTWNMNEDSNTLKVGQDPETHEVNDTPRPRTTVVVDLDPSGYGVCLPYDQWQAA